MSEVFVFDVQDPDRLRPRRGIVHEVHRGADGAVLVSGSIMLRHDEIVRSNLCFKPFLKMAVVESFTVSDPVMTKWPHLGRFAALSYTEGVKS